MIELTRRRRKGARGGDGRRLVRAARVALEAEGVEGRELSLLLTDDKEIRQLNAIYANKDKATDVLSFALDEAGGPVGPLGDVIISVETAARQATSRRVDLDHELELLLVHGVLHLLGYDHADPEDARVMRSRTRAIRRKISKSEALRRG